MVLTSDKIHEQLNELIFRAVAHAAPFVIQLITTYSFNRSDAWGDIGALATDLPTAGRHEPRRRQLHSDKCFPTNKSFIGTIIKRINLKGNKNPVNIKLNDIK